MDMSEYYLRLKTRYPAQDDDTWFAVTMDELAEVFDCTRRNAQFLIRKLQDQQYIGWKSGLGRGNTSQLAFLRNREALILERAQSLATQGQISEAFELLGANEAEALHAEFRSWLGEQFGVQKQPSETDVLRYPFYRPVLELDPMKVVRRTEAHLIRQLFDTLMEYDPGAKQLKPGLAHHLEHDDDYTTWTFYLRKGVLFHHSKRLNADDVKYTFERIRQWNGADWLLQSVREIEVLSAYSLRVVLRERNALFAHFIATERFAVVPGDLELLAARRDYARLPVGTGPFRIRSNTDSRLVLEANDQYFAGRPFLDRVEMWVWPNYEEELRERQALKQAQVLYFEALHKGESGQTLNQLELGSSVLTFNLSSPGIVQDISLREAIHLAISRKQLIHELQGRRTRPSSGFDPNHYDPAYANDCSVNAALERLQASAYAGEVLQLYTYEYFSNEEDVRWIQEACGRIGIHLELNVLPIGELSQAEVIAQADLIYAGEVLGDQPSITLLDMYRSNNGYIHNHLHPELRPRVEQLLSEALAEPDEDQRMAVLREVEEELKRRFNVLFLFHSVQEVGHDPLLHGISLNAWGKINYRDIWVK